MSRARNPVQTRIHRLVEHNAHIAPGARTRQAGKHQRKCKREQALSECPLQQVASVRKFASYGASSWSPEFHIVINTFALFCCCQIRSRRNEAQEGFPMTDPT